jgi:hypothetical protein
MGAACTFAQLSSASGDCESTAERPDGRRWRQGDTEPVQEAASRTCRASRRTPLYLRRIGCELSTPTGLHLHEWPGSALARSLHPGPTHLMQPHLDRPNTYEKSWYFKSHGILHSLQFPSHATHLWPAAHPLHGPSRQTYHPPSPALREASLVAMFDIRFPPRKA